MARNKSKRWDLPRHPALITAAILHDGLQRVCVIEERSPLGARLRINPDLNLPRRFGLEIERDRFVFADLAWRNGDRAGVRLDLPGAPKGLLAAFKAWLQPDAGSGS